MFDDTCIYFSNKGRVYMVCEIWTGPFPLKKKISKCHTASKVESQGQHLCYLRYVLKLLAKLADVPLSLIYLYTPNALKHEDAKAATTYGWATVINILYIHSLSYMEELPVKVWQLSPN